MPSERTMPLFHAKKCVVAFLILFSCCITGVSYSQTYPPNFYPSTEWSIQMSWPFCQNLEVADVNRDGWNDVIIGNRYNTYVYYGKADYPDKYNPNKIYRGEMLKLLDYNGDGLQDMVCIEYISEYPTPGDSTGQFLYYFGKPGPGLLFADIPDHEVKINFRKVQRSFFARAGIGDGVLKGDFNADGKEDMLVAASEYIRDSGDVGPRFYGKYFVYLGKVIPNSIPDFTAAKPHDSSTEKRERYYGYYHGVGDINGDGIDDILIGSNITSTITPQPDSLHYLMIYYGGTNFVFGRDNYSKKYISKNNEKQYWSEWFKPPFTVLDFNGDGIGDLCCTPFMNDGTNNYTMNVHYGSTGELDTIPNKRFPKPSANWDIRGNGWNIGDLNGDGWNDFVFRANMEGVTFLLGGPYAKYSNPAGLRGFEYTYTPPTRAMAFDDVNKDGAMEVILNDASGLNLQTPYINFGGVYILKGDKRWLVDVQDEAEILSKSKDMGLNIYPNPSNGGSRIVYYPAGYGVTRMTVYNITGEKMCELMNEYRQPEKSEIYFNPSAYGFPAGVYFIKIEQKEEKTGALFSGTIKYTFLK